MRSGEVAALLGRRLRQVQALNLAVRFDRQSLLAICQSLPDEVATVTLPPVVDLAAQLQRTAQQWQDEEMLPDERRVSLLHTRVQAALLTALRLLAG